MKTVSASLLLALAFIAIPGALPVLAQDCDVSYRLQQDGQNTYYKPGQVIVLRVGERAELFIHGHTSRSADPYSASAEIDAPAAYGIGSQRRQDIGQILRLGQHDPDEGRISFTAIAAGETALGYWIFSVVPPGQVDNIPAGCRIGQVEIRVVRHVLGVDGPPAHQAAHALITGLYTGILRRSQGKAEDYPETFFEQVQRGGLQGLISIAETMTTSPEFRNAALDRTREGLRASGVSTERLSQVSLQNQLLTDIFQSLYGHEPDPGIRRIMAETLSSCLSGNAALCRELGRNLLELRHYYDHHQELLQHWSRE